MVDTGLLAGLLVAMLSPVSFGAALLAQHLGSPALASESWLEILFSTVLLLPVLSFGLPALLFPVSVGKWVLDEGGIVVREQRISLQRIVKIRISKYGIWMRFVTSNGKLRHNILCYPGVGAARMVAAWCVRHGVPNEVVKSRLAIDCCDRDRDRCER